MAGFAAAYFFIGGLARVAERIDRAAKKAGLPNYNGAFCGHTIGIEARELPYTLSEPIPLNDPFLPETSDIPFPAGAVLSVELPSGKFGEGGVHAEYTVLVTETGLAHLGAAKREHFVV